MPGRTLYDKLWEDHVVYAEDDGSSLIYIDRHLVHEVTSPQAFESLRLAGRKPWRQSRNLAVANHNVPTTDRDKGIADPVSRLQVETLDKNCAEFGITEFAMSDARQGIVHVIGSEQGATLPGMTVVCGDSHTSTHGASGALAFGIGTSEVEHVLATQCLIQKKAKNLLIKVNGRTGVGVTAKDIVLVIIGKIGTAGGNGYTIEFAGSAIRALSMEGRMTVCNMAIEAGARAGLVAVDDITINYYRNRPYSPKGEHQLMAELSWQNLHSDEDAVFDKVVELNAALIKPQVTWGTSPELVLAVDETIPDPALETDKVKQQSMLRALQYMDLKAGQAITDIMLDKIFVAAGFEWREPGCSMCLAMNADRLEAGERCASTSNRNFEDSLFKELITGYQLTIDLEAQQITTPYGRIIDFDVDETRKHCLLNGLDDIALSLQHADKIKAYEVERAKRAPWLFVD